MIKINKALVVLGMLLLAAVASAAQEAETVQQAEAQPVPSGMGMDRPMPDMGMPGMAMPGMEMPFLNARRLHTFKGGYYGYNPYFYGYYGYPFFGGFRRNFWWG